MWLNRVKVPVQGNLDNIGIVGFQSNCSEIDNLTKLMKIKFTKNENICILSKHVLDYCKFSF